MARYRITCIGQCERMEGHQHPASVGIGKDANSRGTKWTIEAVRDALDRGHRFYAVDGSGVRGDVIPLDCSCGARTITLSTPSDPDHPPLPVCAWAA